ncbi:phosphate transporter subunit; membrane component of ABC superfamily [Verrucomicrobia bacterium]|nr:phosphate transporter subunit; membrane component of ABC superfamily [Verrucomicrobiota bacterium]
MSLKTGLPLPAPPGSPEAKAETLGRAGVGIDSKQESYHRWRNVKNGLVQAVTCLCTLAVLLPLALVFNHVLKSGLSAVNLTFFTGLPKPVGEPGGGMANAIVGTFELLGLAALLGVPVGVCGGIFLAEYGSTKLNWWIRFAADVLNGVPSIIWGMVVYALVVVPRKGFSAWAGGIVLGMIIVPLIMRTSEEMLRLVPQGYREAALALGISQWRTLVQIVLRTALRGITTGILLALARVAGETAPLLFTAFGNRFWNHSLNDPIAALPLQIFSYAISPYEDWHRQAWAGALVLLVLVALVNVSVRLLTRERSNRGRLPL